MDKMEKVFSFTIFGKVSNLCLPDYLNKAILRYDECFVDILDMDW